MQYDNCDFGGEACEVIGFLHRLVSGAQDIDIFSFEKFRIAGCAVGYAVPDEFFFSGNSQLPRLGSQCQYHAAGRKAAAPFGIHGKKPLFLSDACHCGAAEFHGGIALCMQMEFFHQPLAAV